MDRALLIPDDGPPDLRAMHRHARTQQAAARRQGDTRRVRLCHRLIVRCLRALRYEARIKAGRATAYSHCSHPLFSDAPEKLRETLAPTVTPDSDRRRTFIEGRRRR